MAILIILISIHAVGHQKSSQGGDLDASKEAFIWTLAKKSSYSAIELTLSGIVNLIHPQTETLYTNMSYCNRMLICMVFTVVWTFTKKSCLTMRRDQNPGS